MATESISSQQVMEKDHDFNADPESVTPIPSDFGANLEASLSKRPSRLPWLATTAGLCLGALLYGLDTTIAADIQAAAYQDLGEIDKLPWIGLGFPLGSVACILLIGRLYAAFEIKWLMISSIVLFEAGSALCGASPTMNALIVGRVFAGIGGAGMFLGALTYVAVFTSLKERALYNALIGLWWGIGAILGPVIGGSFAQSTASWRWAFYINLPLAAVMSPIYFFIFPRFNPQPSENTLQKLAKIDWVGAFLNASTFVLFMVVLSFSGSLFAWSSPRSITLWTLSGVSIIAFGIQQTFSIFTSQEHRVFPMHFLRSRTLLLMYFTSAAAATGASVAIYYVPLFFQFTRGDSSLEAAVRLLPLILVYVFATMFSGALLPVTGRYAPWYYLAGIPVIIGGALTMVVTPTTHVGALYGFEVLIGWGTGLVFQFGYAISAAKVDPSEIPNTIGFVNVAQIGSIALALSMAGAIFSNVGLANLQSALAPFNLPQDLIKSALAGAQSPIIQSASPEVKAAAIGAIVKTITSVYGMVVAAGAVILVSAFAMSWEKLQLDPVKAAVEGSTAVSRVATRVQSRPQTSN